MSQFLQSTSLNAWAEIPFDLLKLDTYGIGKNTTSNKAIEAYQWYFK